MVEEHRARNILFKQLMSVQHRLYGPMVAQIRQALRDDPDFTSRACVFMAQESKVRDQQDAAIIALLQSAEPAFREAGRCLLLGNDFYNTEPTVAGLPPYRIFRIERYMRSPFKVIKDRQRGELPYIHRLAVPDTTGEGEEVARFVSKRAAEKAVDSLAKRYGRVRIEVDEEHTMAPRLMHNVMADYIQALEKDPVRFDGIVLKNRRAVKEAYTHYHFPAGKRARAILFDNKPPGDSRLAILKLIANSSDEREQAKLILHYGIPYPVAASVLPKVGPIVGIAMVGAMTPTEALNSRAWVERSGLLENETVKAAYLAKVQKATASVASADFRKSAQGKDEEVTAAISVAKEAAVAREQGIQKPTLLLVDKSGSLERYFNVAQEIGSRIAPLCRCGFQCVLFNEFAQELTVEKNTLSGWKEAFRLQRASGRTSPVAGLEYALSHGFEPQQIVIETDGGENAPDMGAFAKRVAKLDTQPNVVVIGVPTCMGNVVTPYDTEFTRTLEDNGLIVDEFLTDGSDYYIYDQIVAVLGGPPAISIVQRILETQLPRRV